MPFDLRQRALAVVHSDPAGGHFGYDKTIAKCRNRFFWPGMSADVLLFVRHCSSCARQKSAAHPLAPLSPMLAGYPNEIVGMDIVGPLPPTSCHSRFILVCVDYFTRWPEAFPLSNISAPTVASVFSSNWIARYGAPEQLHTDQGPQFESALMASLCDLFNIRKTRTTPYHPQSDGLVERMNHTLKAALRTYATDTPDWDLNLPYVLLSYRSAVHKSTTFTPAKLFLGHELRLPADIVYSIPNTTDRCNPADFVDRLDAVLSCTFRLAREHSGSAHHFQKDCYDRRSHGHPFNVGIMCGYYAQVSSVKALPHGLVHFK